MDSSFTQIEAHSISPSKNAVSTFINLQSNSSIIILVSATLNVTSFTNGAKLSVKSTPGEIKKYHMKVQ